MKINSKTLKATRFLLVISLLVYIFLLLYLTILKRLYYGTVTGLLLENYNLKYDVYLSNSVNLIPLKTIYIYLINPPSAKIALTNIYGNILAFIPLGFFLPALWNKYRSFSRIFIVSLITSIAIEIIQLILRVGSTDIDDVILNTIGGLLGFMIIYIILRFTKKTDGFTNQVDDMS